MIPTSSDFLSFPGPVYRLLESYINDPYAYSKILLKLKQMSHANYDTYHRHIITSKRLRLLLLLM